MPTRRLRRHGHTLVNDVQMMSVMIGHMFPSKPLGQKCYHHCFRLCDDIIISAHVQMMSALKCCQVYKSAVLSRL